MLCPNQGADTNFLAPSAFIKSPNCSQEGALIGFSPWPQPERGTPLFPACPQPLLHFLARGCHLMCPHLTKPGSELIFNWVPSIIAVMVITLCPAQHSVND